MLRGERLREMREKLGLTQRELSRLSGLGDNMIYRYEKGLSDITGNSLTTVAENLGVSADYLLGLSDDPHVQLRDTSLNDVERDILDRYRRESWSGIIQLGVKHLSK